MDSLSISLSISIGLFVILMVMNTPSGKAKKNERCDKVLPLPAIKMLNCKGDPHDDEFYTYISGAFHHATESELGGFYGVVTPEPDNTYDHNAMAVCNTDMKLLGYIPASELSEYRKWSCAAPMPCIGYIYVENKQVHGRVKIFKPCSEEFLADQFQRYLDWISKNMGPEYLPKSNTMQFKIDQ